MATQYEVVRAFSRTDRRTGLDTAYKEGDTYPGPVDQEYLTSANGPDGRGPLIAEKAALAAERAALAAEAAADAAAAAPAAPAPTSGPSKEK